MVELWFGCFEYYPYRQMLQNMLLCGVGAKPMAHLMLYHLLQWEVVKVKQLMNSNMTLTVLNLHQKRPKGATTKIQVKRYKRDKILLDISVERQNSIRYARSKVKSRSHLDRVSVPSPIAIDVLMDTMARDRAHIYLFSV